LAESKRLARILELVAQARTPLVIVPGGGAFADAVRAAQAEHGFSDAEAHRMALLAMHQTGMMMAALQPRLKPVETLAGLNRTARSARIPVWLPLKLVTRDGRISPDWSTTSDGLAARLAERLGRAPVVLVKSCRVPKRATLATLARDGVVDPTFAAIVDRARLAWRVLGAGDEGELGALLKVTAQGDASRTKRARKAGRRAPTPRAIARRR
jgi:5-(aminomethyl)-3-furanmethanol phosphate kinase